MRRRDIELITALVDGSLEDETEARARIQASERLSAEYDAQIRARSSLMNQPVASLSESERAALHRDVWTALTTGDSKERRSARANWAYVAAGGLAVVALVVVLGQVTPTGEMATLSDAPAEEGGVETSVTTMAVVTADDAGAPEAADSDQLAAFAMQARVGDLAYEPASARASSCVDEAGAVDMELLGELEQDGRRYALLVPDVDSVGPDSPIVFVDLETCEIAHRDG
jgi:hypothetical protein